VTARCFFSSRIGKPLLSVVALSAFQEQHVKIERVNQQQIAEVRMQPSLDNQPPVIDVSAPEVSLTSQSDPSVAEQTESKRPDLLWVALLGGSLILIPIGALIFVDHRAWGGALMALGLITALTTELYGGASERFSRAFRSSSPADKKGNRKSNSSVV
jgi:hypothetical protein